MNARPVVPVLAVLAILATALPAHAQDEEDPTASIRLLSQTPWTTPEDPVLRLLVQLRNGGSSTIHAPELGWTLGPRIGARDEYEQALVEGPELAAADTVALSDLGLSELRPGAVEEIPQKIDMSQFLAIDTGDSGVYPLQLELRSEGIQIAAITTAAIHITQPPQKRVAFSWWTEIDVAVAFAPDGTLIDPGFEQSLEAGDGIVAQVAEIAKVVAALDAATDRPTEPAIDLVIAPLALDQLEQAANGYRRPDGTTVSDTARPAVAALETLGRLRTIADSPAVLLHAMPFAAPRLPSLLSSDLEQHLDDQWRLGEATFERLLGESSDDRVARPPGLALDEASIDVLADRGATTILGAADSVERPTDPLDLAPPPAARISTAIGNRVDILLPDPSTEALLLDRELRTADPIRAAQVVLGELATIWREQPVPPDPEVRGLALDLPRDLPAAMWGAMLRRLTSAPFLEPVHADDLPARINPEPLEAVLDRSRRGGFSPSYVSALVSTAQDVSAFASIVREPEGDAARLQRAILYAEASEYVGDESAGHEWIEWVNTVTERTFAALAPDTSRVLTFTSRTGRIPLRMGNPGNRVVQVMIELRSQRVDFLGTGARTVRLDQAHQVVTFDAEVKAAGRSSIEVVVLSPSGLELSRSVLVVSSTALNPIALIITAGAGLMLVGLWSRRLFRRRNR